MNWTTEYTDPRWEITLKRGGGKIIVAGATEAAARNAAVAEYRRTLGYVDFCKSEDIVKSMVLLDART